MTAEWRLVIDKGHVTRTYAKRNLEHAEKGLADSCRDSKRRRTGSDWTAWIETRTVTEWEKQS